MDITGIITGQNTREQAETRRKEIQDEKTGDTDSSDRGHRGRRNWVTPDTDEVSEYVPNAVDLYLPSNPTTGYSWTYEIEDPSIVSLRDEYFSQSMGSDLVGAGGTHWFHISGEQPGITSVTFRYLRSWETDVPPAEQTTYRLSVNDQLDVMIWGVEVA